MWWLPVLVVLRRQGPVPVHVGGRILIPFFCMYLSTPFLALPHCHYGQNDPLLLGGTVLVGAQH